MKTDTTDLAERRRDDAATRHALAMQAIGLIRTALHLQRSTYEALIQSAETSNDLVDRLPRSGRVSFDLQVRMAKVALRCLHELDVLANETIELAISERENTS